MSMEDCPHDMGIQTFRFGDGSPAGIWSCTQCARKFVPLDLEQQKDAERYRWLRDVAGGGDWERIGHTTDPTNTDAEIDAAIAADLARPRVLGAT